MSVMQVLTEFLLHEVMKVAFLYLFFISKSPSEVSPEYLR